MGFEFKREKIIGTNNYTEGLKNLFEFINKNRGIDFSLYRQATIKRKLKLRLDETGKANSQEYLSYLKLHPEEVDVLINTLTINVSNFFRNPLVYELLFSEVLPELISGFRFLKVWSVGCANGEEPYSIAMMTNELLKREQDYFDVSIFGCDIDSEAVGRALKGEYREGELSEVKKKHMDAFFRQVSKSDESLSMHEDVYKINDEIKAMVKFESSDLIADLKTGRKKLGDYNLILCRNVLIYMNMSLQAEVFKDLSDKLYENGYLVIGATETLPESLRENFEQVFPGVKIFKKKAGI